MEKILVCLNCSKKFTTTANAAKYCSPKCRRQANQPPKAYIRHLTCTYCGEKFDSPRRKQYCSDDCRLRANGRCSIKKAKKHSKPKVSIEDVARLSSIAGMSYGKYVLTNNL